MTTKSAESQNALAFARQHDWGQRAYIETDISGVSWVSGLRDVWNDGNRTRVYRVSRPATVRALREFGGY